MCKSAPPAFRVIRSISPHCKLWLLFVSCPCRSSFNQLSCAMTLTSFLSSGPTAKPSVKYAENITTSPQPQSAAESFSVQHSSSYHTNDNDHDGEASYYPPRSTTDPYQNRRRTSAQSSRRRMTWGGHNASAETPIGSKDKASSKMPLLQRVRTKMSSLLVPEHRVGKPPGFGRELRTIVFGSCESPALSASSYVWFTDAFY